MGPRMNWTGSNELRVVLNRARAHLLRNGLQVTGKLTINVTDSTPDLYRLALAMRKVKVDSSSSKVPIYLESLDMWLRQAPNDGRSLIDVLNAEEPLVDRPAMKAAARTSLEDEWSRIDEVLADPKLREWRDLIDEFGVTDPEVLSGTMRRVARVLAALPADGVSPVELAEEVLGDTKALTDTAVRRWVLRLLAASREVPEPRTASERMKLWEQFGVLESGVTSRVLTLGVIIDGSPAACGIAEATRSAGIHQVWTLAQLRTWNVKLAPGDVFVCENPTVLQAAERELGSESLPLVCTEGQPSEAAVRLLETARGRVFWHADFDWTGLRTTARAQEVFDAVPWRMDADTYRDALTRGESEPLKARDTKASSPWDPDLARALTESGRAVMEERLIGDLLMDLRRPDRLVPGL